MSDPSEIRDYYRAIEVDIEGRFLDRLDRVVERLLSFPRGAPPVEGFPDIRRARMRPFPYGIFYRLDGDDILILRVLHTAVTRPTSNDEFARGDSRD
jgi:plasmid stabilization system protein ParE